MQTLPARDVCGVKEKPPNNKQTAHIRFVKSYRTFCALAGVCVHFNHYRGREGDHNILHNKSQEVKLQRRLCYTCFCFRCVKLTYLFINYQRSDT